MFPTRAMIFAVCIFFSVALIPLVFKVPDRDRIQIANARWSIIEKAKSEDRIFDKQIDAEHKFKVPPFTDDFDQRSRNRTEITGSAAPAPTANTTLSILIDQSLAIEFPTDAYEPNNFVLATKRHPMRRAKVSANKVRRVSNNSRANSEGHINYYQPLELPQPNFTTSAY